MGTIDVVNDQRLRDIQREYLEFLEDEVRPPSPLRWSPVVTYESSML